MQRIVAQHVVQHVEPNVVQHVVQHVEPNVVQHVAQHVEPNVAPCEGTFKQRGCLPVHVTSSSYFSPVLRFLIRCRLS